MPGNIKGKTILITGATDGIGKMAAIMLSKDNTVIIHGKDPAKGKQTLSEIESENKNKESGTEGITGGSLSDKPPGRGGAYYVNADLASLKAVKDMAFEIKDKFDSIDILINNAGIFSRNKEITEDRFEKTFAVNYLSHFCLTLSLLNLYGLRHPGNIMNVSSMAHLGINYRNFLGIIDFKDYYDGHDAYSISKLCQILFTYKLADKLKDKGILSNCLHPGVISTKLLKAGWPAAGTAYNIAISAVSKFFPAMDNSSTQRGALNEISAIESAEEFGLTGKYFVNGREVKSSSLSYDKSLQDELWDLTVKAAGVDLKNEFDK